MAVGMTVTVRVTMGVVMTVGMGMRHEIGPEPVETRRQNASLSFMLYYNIPQARSGSGEMADQRQAGKEPGNRQHHRAQHIGQGEAQFAALIEHCRIQ